MKFKKRQIPWNKGKGKDLTGMKFGRLMVIKKVGVNTQKHQMYLCKCDCGNEKVIDGYKVKNGNTKSCGCLHKEVTSKRSKITLGLASMRARILNYKAAAKKRGHEYKLTEEQFKEITQKDCYYCGAKPNNISYHKQSNGTYTYNGIDRVDNTKGYTMDNVVPCCKDCNGAKGKLTLQEFKDLIERIYKRMF